jgi:hypothetical protein
MTALAEDQCAIEMDDEVPRNGNFEGCALFWSSFFLQLSSSLLIKTEGVSSIVQFYISYYSQRQLPQEGQLG